jgi:Zn-dependent protease
MGFSRPKRDTWSSVLISLAGPGAGFLLAGCTALLLVLAGGDFDFVPPTLASPFFWQETFPPNTADGFKVVVRHLFLINIFWGLINLVPVLPLDGGQVARDLLMHRDKAYGLVHAVQLSIAVGAVMAIFLWAGLGETYAALMFALLAVSNYLTLQQLGRNW